ncbi:MAG: carboxypeptidase-like regulatory domain-containing protein [Oscillospiraceae bacterium]|nr:carboxypeptidase-like regulatory domain-containing protein [Oscillospiraceae bacterium]
MREKTAAQSSLNWHIIQRKIKSMNGGQQIMGIGTLRVRVTTNSGIAPVPNASVVIDDILGYLAHSLTTNQDGMTSTVELFAPVKNFYTDVLVSGPAYSLYQITVSHPEYKTQIVRGVQVFDGVESILPVDLMQLGLNVGLTQLDIVDIPPTAVSPGRT